MFASEVDSKGTEKMVPVLIRIKLSLAVLKEKDKIACEINKVHQITIQLLFKISLDTIL